MDRVRLAIVGCGNISRLNAPGYLQHPRGEVVALCDTVPERAKRRAQEWASPPGSTRTWPRCWTATGWTRWSCSPPTWLHADQIVAALGAGKHVSCQKPLATTVAEADRIVAALWIGEIGEVSAIVTRGADFLVETPSVITWRFKGRDCLGIVDYTYAPEVTVQARYARVDEFFEIHGSRGVICVTRCSGELLDLPPVLVIRARETVAHDVPCDWRLGFDGAAADFVDALLEGRQPAQDVHAARRMLQVPLAIYESGRTGRMVAPESMAWLTRPAAPRRPRARSGRTARARRDRRRAGSGS